MPIEKTKPVVKNNLEPKTPVKKTLKKKQVTIKPKSAKSISTIKEDLEKLEAFKEEFEDNPASELIAVRLSPSRTYLRETPTNLVRLEESEGYCRSDSVALTKKKHLLPAYKAHTLKYGAQAHVGNYGNIMQLLGDEFEPSDEAIETTQGDGKLYYDMMTYKKEMCQYIIDQVQADKGTALITSGYYNEYPCIMIHIHEDSVCKSKHSKSPSAAAFAEWVNFLISYFVGLLNFNAYKSEIPIEMERRASFGFLTPTIAPTGASIRINLGLIPKCYADLLVKSIKQLDKVLQDAKEEELSPIPEGIFYGSKAHKTYLNKKYKTPELDNLVQLLFAQVDKSGRTTVQNLVRTAFARDGIELQVFEKLNEAEDNAPIDALLAGLEWSVGKISIKEGKAAQLHFEKKGDIAYQTKFPLSPVKVVDPAFWTIIQKIASAAAGLKDSKLDTAVERIEDSIKNKNITNLYYRLEFLNELIFIKALEPEEDEELGDGYGSDSDTEEAVEGINICSKKIITHNGMRAIWAAMITSANHLGKSRIFLDNAYYEAPLGLPLIQMLHNLPLLTVVKQASEANIILYDLNACVTSGKKKPDYKIEGDNKIIILDATSAAADTVNKHINRFC